MTLSRRRTNGLAGAGTAIVWIFIILLICFSGYKRPQRYKTVKIQLSSQTTPKIAPKQDAAPPMAPQVADKTASPAPSQASASGKKEQQSQGNASARKNSEKASAKTSKNKNSASNVPATKPAPAAQVLQKSTEELMAEQLNNKPKKKKEFDWSSFDEVEGVESESSVSDVVSAKPVDTFTGKAGLASSGNTGTSSSSSSSDKNLKASEGTLSALGEISVTRQYSSNSGNGVTSTSDIKSAAAPEGRIAMIMNDGSGRTLLEPKEPKITLSPVASATIDASVNIQITFNIAPDGSVPLNGIIIPKSVAQAIVRDEIAAQISRWRFDQASTSATATFVHKIVKH